MNQTGSLAQKITAHQNEGEERKTCGIWGAKKGALKSQAEMLSKHPTSPAPTFSSQAPPAQPCATVQIKYTCCLSTCSADGGALPHALIARLVPCRPSSHLSAASQRRGQSNTTHHAGGEPGAEECSEGLLNWTLVK